MLTEEQARKALTKHQQAAYGYHAVKAEGMAGDEGIIEFSMKMWDSSLIHRGLAEDIEHILRAAADHIKLRYLGGE